MVLRFGVFPPTPRHWKSPATSPKPPPFASSFVPASAKGKNDGVNDTRRIVLLRTPGDPVTNRRTGPRNFGTKRRGGKVNVVEKGDGEC